MKRTIFLIFLSCVTAGFSQTLPYPPDVARFTYNATNFDIIWNVANNWPKYAWIYKNTWTTFSDETISNLLSFCSLSKTDAVAQYTSKYQFYYWKAGRDLRISFSDGEINYYNNSQSGTYMVTNLPSIQRALELTRKWLPKFGIQLAELVRTNGQPALYYDPHPQGAIIFYTNRPPVTNLTYRAVSFRRTLDGLKWYGAGGMGVIDYGENSEPYEIRIEWRSVKRAKQVKTATKKEILKWLKDGHCYFPHWFYPPYQDKIDIDWRTVKKLVINKVEIQYYGDYFPNRVVPDNSFDYPCGDLFSTVYFGNTNLNIEIDCPIYANSK